MSKSKIPEDLKHLRTRAGFDKNGVASKPFFGHFQIISHYGGWFQLDGEGNPIRPQASDALSDSVDWRKVAEGLMKDFFPGLHVAQSSGRPKVDRADLVDMVNEVMVRSDVTSINQACNILQNRGIFTEIDDLRSAYYREKKPK